MKKSMFIILMSLLLGLTEIMAQEISGGMINALKKGSANELSEFFGETVELVILNDTKEYNKQGAQQAINDFFSKNKVTGFALNHQGTRNGSGFIVGTLTSVTAIYRLNCFFKKNGSQNLIYQIRIDKTNE